MNLWDSIKKGAGNTTRLITLQGKIKNNQQLTTEELKEFEELSKRTPLEDVSKNPSKYFKTTSKYGSLEIDENKKMFKIGFNVYHFDELNTYELIENGSSITSGGLGVGRAIVGGVLLGGVGAIIGGVTKKKKQTNYVDSLKILVTFKNRKPISTTINYIKKKQAKDKKYDKILLSAQETLSGFNFIVNSIEKNQNIAIEPVFINDSSTDITEKLRQYKELLDEGILTQKEFETKKKELLNL